MKYIIDTHILLWLIFDPDKIDAKKLDLLKDPKNSVYVSNISFWEIALKFSLGKLELEGLNPDELPDVAKQMGIETHTIDTKSMSGVYKLPQITNHKDPFDRLIINDCIQNGYTLVSYDSKFKHYESLGLKIL